MDLDEAFATVLPRAFQAQPLAGADDLNSLGWDILTPKGRELINNELAPATLKVTAVSGNVINGVGWQKQTIYIGKSTDHWLSAHL